jgi:glycosyltransferase involved in cell wall biosynthesis
LRVLPNSVDLAQIRSSQAMPVDHPAFQTTDIPVIITAGRLAPEKRIDILLEAASYLALRIQFNLVILGEGAQRSQLEQLASDLGISARTFFLGFQPNPWKFIGKSAVFALASDFEGFGNVLIEAMACGVPVVTTRAPFGPEYILSSSTCGLLVPTGDPVALAEALQRMLSDTELRQHCVAGGFKRAADFDIGQISRTFAELVLQAAGHD